MRHSLEIMFPESKNIHSQIMNVKDPFEGTVLTEAAVGLKGHSLVERASINIQ